MQMHLGKKAGISMWEKVKDNKLITLILITGVVYLFLKYLSPLIAPILVAMLFVTIFGPALKKMQEKLHINRQIGAIMLLILACAIIALIVWILFSWIVGSLPVWLGQLDIVEEEISVLVHTGCETVGKAIGIDSQYLETTILSRINEGIDYFQSGAVPSMLSQTLEYAKAIVTFGAFLITFIIASVLLAKDYDRIMNNLLDREECHVLLEVICGIIRYIATFVKAQLVIMISIATLAAIVLSIAQIKHGAMWGILAGLFDVLPFIGTGIVLVPLSIIQLFQGFYGKALTGIALYCVCAFLREILEPKLIGKKIGVPAIAVLLSVYAGIQLFGIWGIIKGPLGFMVIYQSYSSIQRKVS